MVVYEHNILKPTMQLQFCAWNHGCYLESVQPWLQSDRYDPVKTAGHIGRGVGGLVLTPDYSLFTLLQQTFNERGGGSVHWWDWGFSALIKPRSPHLTKHHVTAALMTLDTLNTWIKVITCSGTCREGGKDGQNHIIIRRATQRLQYSILVHEL